MSRLVVLWWGCEWLSVGYGDVGFSVVSSFFLVAKVSI